MAEAVHKKHVLEEINDRSSSVRPAVFITILFCAAFIIKSLFLYKFQNSLFSNLLILDMEDYDKWALAVSRGQLIGKSAFNGLPFYPYFLGFIYFLIGHSLFAVRLLQIALGSASCVLVFVIARRLFDPSIGLVSYFLMLLFKEFYVAEMMLLPATFGIFFYLAITALLFSLFEKPGLLKIIFIGILTGISCLTRAYMLFLLPVISVILWYSFRKEAIRKYTYIACFLLFGLLVISTATAHNYLAARDFVPITAHGGANLYIGNNPAADGTSVKVPFAVGTGSEALLSDMRMIAEKESKRPLKPSEVSAFWTSKAMVFMNQNPGLFLRLLINKLNIFFCGFDISDMISYRALSDYMPILNLFFLDFRWVIPFALVGLAVTFSKRREFLFVYSVIAGHIISIILFLVVGRYRLPLAPFFIIFCGAFFIYFSDWISAGKFQNCVIAVASAAALFVYLNNGAFERKYNLNLGGNYAYVGGYFLNKGDYPKAAELFERAVMLEPRRAEARNMLGLGYYYNGDYDKAMKEYREALELNPNLYEAHNNLGVALEKVSRQEEAVLQYEKSLSIKSDQPYIKERLRKLKAGLW